MLRGKLLVAVQLKKVKLIKTRAWERSTVFLGGESPFWSPNTLQPTPRSTWNKAHKGTDQKIQCRAGMPSLQGQQKQTSVKHIHKNKSSSQCETQMSVTIHHSPAKARPEMLGVQVLITRIWRLVRKHHQGASPSIQTSEAYIKLVLGPVRNTKGKITDAASNVWDSQIYKQTM